MTDYKLEYERLREAAEFALEECSWAELRAALDSHEAGEAQQDVTYPCPFCGADDDCVHYPTHVFNPELVRELLLIVDCENTRGWLARLRAAAKRLRDSEVKP